MTVTERLERTRHERASLVGCAGEPLKRNVSQTMRRVIKQPSLSELAGKYVVAIANAKAGKGYLPMWSCDLSLYMGKFQLWFESPMQY